MIHKIFLLFIFIYEIILPQQSDIKGKVINEEDGSPLYNVNIQIVNSGFATSTNNSGEFIIKNIPAGFYTISFSYIGFATRELEVEVLNDSIVYLNAGLHPEIITYKNIIVTSTKFEKNAEEVAFPLEVITNNNLNEKNFNTLSDAAAGEPGIALQRDGIWATSLNIRGLSGQRIVTLIDGYRIETATDLAAGLSLIDMNEIERIEVLKGAASPLYGTGALGGIVNIITKKNSFKKDFYFGGSFSSGFNSVNNLKMASLNLFSGNDSWFASITGSLRDASDTKIPGGVLPNSGYKDENISAKFGLKIIENLELHFQYQNYSAYDVGIPGGNPLFPASAVLSYPFIKRNLFSVGLSAKKLPGGFNGTLKFFSQNIYRNVENIPNTFVRMDSPERIIYNQKILPDAKHYTTGIQLQLEKLIFKNNYFIFGIDAWNRNLDSRRERFQRIDFLNENQQVINSVLRVTGERPIPESSFLSLGFFIQDEIYLVDEKLILTIGGRADQITISNEEVKQPLYEISNGILNNSPANQSIIWKKNKTDDLSWSSNINILYKIDKNFDITFNASKSFRSPNLEERFQYIDQAGLLRVGNPDLLPEEAYFFDAGLRWKENFINFFSNFYLNYLENMVVEKPGVFEGRAAQIKTNVGKAILYGTDFRINFALKKANIYTNFSYIRGKDTGENENLPQIPPLNGVIGFNYRILNNFLSDFYLRAFNSQKLIAEGEFTTPGYVIFNWLLVFDEISFYSYKFKISVGAENLLNKSYRDHLSTNRGLIVSEPGRNFFIKLYINW